MKIRRFYSKNMRGALRQIADVFGDDAAILSSRKVAGGVEVIAALDYDETLLSENENESFVHNESSTRNESPSEGESSITGAPSTIYRDPKNGVLRDHQQSRSSQSFPGAEDSFDKRDFWDDAGRNRNSVGGQLVHPSSSNHDTFSENYTAQQKQATVASESYSSTKQLDSQVSQAKVNSEHYSATTVKSENEKEHRLESHHKNIEWGADPSLIAMKEELGMMRAMMSEQLKGIAWSRLTEQNPMRAMLMRRLSGLGIDSSLHQKLLSGFNPGEDAECSWQTLLATIARTLPVGGQNLLEVGGIYAFMGPAGVGKTTTIAKLAARHIIKHGAESVALITTDNYRVSAQEQLSTFGRLLKVPVAKVSAQNSLSDLLQNFANKRLILIDTAGMSEKDSQISTQFNDICNAGTKIMPVLLISAASQLTSMKRVLSLYCQYKPKCLIFTKLDEAASLGDCLSFLMANPLPVIFTCDGQKIPEDIRLARSHHLVAKAVWLANKYENTVDEWRLAQATDATSNLARSA